MIAIIADDLPGQEEIGRLRAALGPTEIGDANTSQIDGARASLSDIQSVTNAMPFFGDRRLVVVRRMLNQYESKSGEGSSGRGKEKAVDRETALREWFESLPETTDLLFLEEHAPPADSRNPLVRAVVAAGGTIRASRALSPDDVVDWLLKRAKTKGGSIAADAAEILAAAHGADTPAGAREVDLRLLDSELAKLLTYADGVEVTASDVRTLVADDRQESVFGLVDAIGRRDRRSSMRTLRAMIDSGANVQYLLTMIGRQVRLLLQVKAAAEAVGQSNDAVAAALKMRPWQVRNLLAQARLFSDAQLRRAFALIVAADRDIKTGVCDGDVALDLLVATLAAADEARPRVGSRA